MEGNVEGGEKGMKLFWFLKKTEAPNKNKKYRGFSDSTKQLWNHQKKQKEKCQKYYTVAMIELWDVSN